MRNEISVNSDNYVDRQISSGAVFMVQSLDGNELQYDKLDCTLDLHSFIPTLFVPRGATGLLTSEEELFGVRPRVRILVADPSSYKPGAVVLYKHNGSLVGKYYMDHIERVGKTQYRIDCVSPVGVLSKSKHYGGVYNGILFPALIAEIIGDVIPHTVSPDLADQVVYGWLPVASRRDNLHQALFAMGAAAQKDESGDLYIGPLYGDAYTTLPEGRIYTGGSVKYPNKAAKVSVVEHSYVALASDTSTTLFNGAVAADAITTPNGMATEGAIILFDNPVHDLSCEGGTILESGVNYAVLGPAGNCTLTGQQYTHTTREIVRSGSGADGDMEVVFSAQNSTLISVVNSENVLNRLYQYYSAAKTVSLPIVVDAERAGSVVQFEDPFGDLTKGIIASMDVNMSNTLKGDVEIIANYSPGSAGNFYTNFAVVSESGYWTVPDGVSKIRVVLIGGGDGGYSGEAGESGEDGPTYTNLLSAVNANAHRGNPGNGGAGGKGGSPGKVYTATLDVNPGDTFEVVIGLGGAGSVFEGEPGAGSASTFGELSSDNGSGAGAGYAALIGGGVYALPGNAGEPGGRGQESSGERPTITYDGNTWQAGSAGEAGFSSGSYSALGDGGGGGGAAVGADGGIGDDGMAADSVALGGSGGQGATPEKAAPGTIPGSGGTGGHGGGGGGGGGYAVASMPIGGDGGAGGHGGTGGDGAPGIILIYY